MVLASFTKEIEKKEDRTLIKKSYPLSIKISLVFRSRNFQLPVYYLQYYLLQILFADIYLNKTFLFVSNLSIRKDVFLFECLFFYSYRFMNVRISKKLFVSIFFIRIDFIRIELFECLSHRERLHKINVL